MKNRLILGLLVVITTSIISSGCKKKSSENPPAQAECESKYEAFFGESSSTNETASVKYENGKIKSLNSSSAVLRYEYFPDRVMISAAGKNVYRIDVVNALATKITDLSSSFEEQMSYDGNKNLIKIESYSDGKLIDTKTFSYSNGNLATLTHTFTDDATVKRVTSYSYSNDIATKVDSETHQLLFGEADAYIPLPYLGSISKNVLIGSSYAWTANNFQSNINKVYTYGRSGNGTINKIVEETHTVTVGNGIQTQNEQLKQTILITSTCN
jgi:hypothetical protein